MKDAIKKNKVLVVTIIYSILTIPIIYGKVQDGLDPSWQYFLNKVTTLEHIKFGRDVIFTYGPLGFFSCPMPIGYNILVAMVIYLFLYAGQIYFFNKIIRHKKISGYALSGALFILLWSGPSFSAEMYILYCALIALAVLWQDAEDKFAIVYYIVVTTIAFFFKFSTLVTIVCCILLLLLSKIIIHQYNKIWTLSLPFIIVPILYLLYNPSIKDFGYYIRGGIEMSTGYNIAMSTNACYNSGIGIMICMMLIYMIIMVSQAITKNKSNSLLMLWFAPSFFMAYKHGFVRNDGFHIYASYIEILMLFSLLIWLFDYTEIYKQIKNQEKKGAVQAIFMIVLVVLLYINTYWIYTDLPSTISRIIRLPRMINDINEENWNKSVAQLEEIPDAFWEEIGDATYTAYPWEISFIEKYSKADNQYIPQPILQIYAAYTPYLDNRSAELFDSDNAPEYILLSLDTIDGRIPFLESPKTFKAIEENYEVVMYEPDESRFLLKKVQSMNNGDFELLEKSVATYQKDDVFYVSEYSKIKIYTELTALGEITKLFWKIPEVYATITYEDGTMVIGRVLLNNLSGGLNVDRVPYDGDTACIIFSDKESKCAIESIQFTGEGLKYYENEIILEYVEE